MKIKKYILIFRYFPKFSNERIELKKTEKSQVELFEIDWSLIIKMIENSRLKNKPTRLERT